MCIINLKLFQSVNMDSPNRASCSKSRNKSSKFENKQIWTYCPPEILLLIFEFLDGGSLARCLFVSRKWNELARFTLEVQAKWESALKSVCIDAGRSLEWRSRDLSWRKLFMNWLLWVNVKKADIALNCIYDMEYIKKINVYRDKIIVISTNFIRYYKISTFENIREIQKQCLDFNESDSIILNFHSAYNNDNRIILYGKLDENSFNLHRDHALCVDSVLHYCFEKNRCFVLDQRSALGVYTWLNHDWQFKFVARYYGSPNVVVALSVLNDRAYVMMKWGPVYWANPVQKSFDKIFQVDVPKYQRDLIVNVRMFHEYGFLFGVTNRSTTTYSFTERMVTDFKFNVYVLKCPNMSCVTSHGDIIIVGFTDGKVELFLPRKTNDEKMLRKSFNVTDYKRDMEETVIVSLTVQEQEDSHQLFVATHSHIFRFSITHPEHEDYVWDRFPKLVPLPINPLVDLPKMEYN